MAHVDDALVAALQQYTRRTVGDPEANSPASRHYLGTYLGPESVDSNLSVVQLQGGAHCRFVPKLSSVGTVTTGQTVVLNDAPAVPLHITGVLKGDITLAATPVADFNPPSAPGTPAVSAHSASSLTVTWGASTDNVGVTAYDVYVNGTYNQTVATTSATIGNLAASTTYAITVQARDAAYNTSPISGTLNATTDAAGGGSGSFTSQYAATWSRTFNYNGRNEYDDWFGSTCYQGVNGSGNRKSMIGFNDAQIQSDLSGATITACSIRLTFAHWYMNAGGTAVIGTHAVGSPPGTFSQNHAGVATSGGWPVGGTRSVDLGTGIGNEFKSGATLGVTLGPAPSSSSQYYGYAYGAGSGVYVPLLTISFTR